MRLLQLQHPVAGRRVALVREPDLQLLQGCRSIYELANQAVHRGGSISQAVLEQVSGESLIYDSLYEGHSDWQILPCLDHPESASRCLVSGTGLTHRKSADSRQKMHDAEHGQTLTDSMRMYLSGLEGGNPEAGRIGVSPEWFYKGRGEVLKGHAEALWVPSHSEDGGEEAEIAGLYIIDDEGRPWRVGMAQANEFSDHRLERQNYLLLAPSKLRVCSIGPELVVGADFATVSGRVRIYRSGETIWAREIGSGERNMCHSLANIEHHHFKHEAHRQPGDAHVHFLGADAFSFGDGLQLEDGDIMEVSWVGFGRALQNPVHVQPGDTQLVRVRNMV